MTTHTLKIISLHDAQATCSCGGWNYSATGNKTRLEIADEWQKHAIGKDAAPYGHALTARIEAIRTLAELWPAWTEFEANCFSLSAHREYYEHSYSHRRRDPDNCAACALQMYPEPNYSGWLRVYIQAGIRTNTRAALREIERAKKENPNYYLAILRDIRTWKPKFIYRTEKGN